MLWLEVPFAASLAVAFVAVAAGFDLTILHTNDVHARFEQFDKYGGECSEQESSDGKCWGGVARRLAKVNEIRDEIENVVLLDGGDQFQGTMWFYLYKGAATSYFMNIIGYDAMVIGNHEFDNTPEGLRQFLLDSNAAVISSNIDASQEPSIDGLFTKSTVLIVGTEKVGVVGYTHHLTSELSNTGKVELGDEVAAVQAEVDRLVADENINMLIALGHAGHATDLKVAKEVRGIDVVVGGHTNTFLYTGTPPSTEVPLGDYPVLVHPDDDPARNVLVVQDFTLAKYLGRLDVTFDDAGEVVSWEGNPILLDKDVPQDPTVLQEVEEWAEAVRNYSSEYIGTTHVFLDGDCRLTECNLGNFIADAYVRQEIKYPDELKWNDVSIALVNGGGIRTSLFQGELNIGDINTVSPFGNTVDTITIKGTYLMAALEHSVGQYDLVDRSGRFLQFAGLLVTYDLFKPAGSRVAKAEVRCTECQVPAYVPLELDKVYKIVLPSFIVSGGDGYAMIRDNVIEHNYGNLDSAAFADYVKMMTPLTPGLERRIVFLDPLTDPCGTGSASTNHLGIGFGAMLIYFNLFVLLFI